MKKTIKSYSTAFKAEAVKDIVNHWGKTVLCYFPPHEIMRLLNISLEALK